MSDADATEVEVAFDGARFYIEARQDSTEHEVGSTLAEGLGLRHGRHQDIGQSRRGRG